MLHDQVEPAAGKGHHRHAVPSALAVADYAGRAPTVAAVGGFHHGNIVAALIALGIIGSVVCEVNLHRAVRKFQHERLPGSLGGIRIPKAGGINALLPAPVLPAVVRDAANYGEGVHCGFVVLRTQVGRQDYPSRMMGVVRGEPCEFGICAAHRGRALVRGMLEALHGKDFIAPAASLVGAETHIVVASPGIAGHEAVAGNGMHPAVSACAHFHRSFPFNLELWTFRSLCGFSACRGACCDKRDAYQQDADFSHKGYEVFSIHNYCSPHHSRNSFLLQLAMPISEWPGRKYSLSLFSTAPTCPQPS